MKVQCSFPRITMAVVALLVLGLLGAFWPSWIDAAPTQDDSATTATIGDAISYQGTLTNSKGDALTGKYSMRFKIYSAKTGGNLLWDSGPFNVDVQDGLFEVRLGITDDIFNGEALWVTQIVRGETLSPRQEILPAPMAHTLRPGAIIKGTASALPNNYLLDVQMNNDAFAFNRGAIFGQSTTGNAIQGFAENGRALYGQTEDGYAVYGFDGGSDANRGYAGYFYSTNGIGVYGYSNGNRAHPNILAPGVYGQSNQGVGVYGRGDTSNSFSFYNEGGFFEGGKGLYARGTDSPDELGYGARIFSSNYRGMYVQGSSGYFDAYFAGSNGISVASVVQRGSASTIVANAGSQTIASGDLVAMAGVVPSPLTGEPMLAVAKLDATNVQAVIGIADSAISLDNVTNEDGSTHHEFSTADGDIPSNGYLTIVTNGLAPAVNLGSVSAASGVTSSANWMIGDRIIIPIAGAAESADSTADRIVIGKVAGPVDAANGTVPLFIDID